MYVCVCVRECKSIFIQLVLKLFHQTGGLRSCPKGVDTISTAAKLIDQFSLNPIPDWGEPAKEGRDSGGSLRFRPGRRACDLKLFRINYVQRVALSKRVRFEAFVSCTVSGLALCCNRFHRPVAARLSRFLPVHGVLTNLTVFSISQPECPPSPSAPNASRLDALI